VRPYVGDVLVVILIYCSVKLFFNWAVIPVAISVLLFAFAIEIFQYYNGITKLGLENSNLARTVIGTSFAWLDFLTYMIGIGIVLMVEKRVLKKK
jgi:heme/copper-type cytochrome/quinol oxidase subunit 2